MAAASGIINYKGKILIGKKKKDSPKFLAGKWHIPGETIEEGESDEEALIRGIKEEAGLEITVGNFLGTSITPTSKSNLNWYECFSKSEMIIPGSDLEDVKWVDKKEIFNYLEKEVYALWPKQIFDYFKLN